MLMLMIMGMSDTDVRAVLPTPAHAANMQECTFNSYKALACGARC